jgi:protein TonB
MGVASEQLDHHDAYLNKLNRTLTVGLVISLTVHAVLVGLLPHPFEHPHPTFHELQVELVQIPPPAPPVLEPPKSAPEQQPRDAPVKPALPAKPTPTRPRKVAPEPPTAPAAPAVLEAVRSTPDAEPTKGLPVPPAAPSTSEDREKPAPPLQAAANDTRAESAPETPPSFRAAYLRNPEPAYPNASRRLGEQGTVQLRVLVSADGHAARVDLHRSSGFARLDEAAAAAVREWRFVPARRRTTPVEAQVIVPIVFRLEVE